MADDPKHDDLNDILSALRDEETAVREQAIQRLQRYANTAGGFQDDTLTEVEALEEWGKARKQSLQQRSIVEALLIAIDDSSSRVRAWAALMLRHPTTPEAQAALLRHLREDPNEQVRMMCVASLDSTPYSPEKVDGFIDALQDPHYQVVFPACQFLGKLGDPKAIEPLRAVLSNPSWNVRFEACEALVRLRAVDLPLVSLLERLNRQPEADRHNENSP